MRRYVIAAAMLLALGSSACRKMPASDAALEATQDPSGRAGRTGYVAVGIYTPGLPWQRLVAGSAQTNPAMARTVDDQAVIVVQNSLTGDIRACGDMTGYCVGMNPWAKTPGQLTPVSLTDHQPTEAETAAQQKQDAEAAAKKQATLMTEIRKAAMRRHRHQEG